MKKLLLFGLLTLLMLTITGCKEEGEDPLPFNPEISIEDIDINVDQSQSIIYEITPAGTLASVSLEVTDSSVPNVVSIEELTITGVQAGTATITATAVHKQDAEQEFSISTTFTVTVLGSSTTAPGSVLNGGFEDDTTDWIVISIFGDVYTTEVVDNNPHSGEAAFSLWYDDNEDAEGEFIDIELQQTIDNIEPGTYLFSLWYQGTADSILMGVLDADSMLTSETYQGYGYDSVPDHMGYVHFGVEVTITETTDLTLSILVEGQANAWGYIDDIGFNEGTIDDLLKAPQSNEEGYINFIENGDFESIGGWTIDISGDAASKTATVTSGALSLWSTGTATFDVYRDMELEANTYHLVLYINGGVPDVEFNATEAYFYITDGTNTYTEDLTPEGWNTGIYKRLEIVDLSLSGTVEVGVHVAFEGGSNNWINLNDFYLFSEDYLIPDPDEVVAGLVDDMILALPAVTDVEVGDQLAIEEVRSAYDELTETQKGLVTEFALLVSIEAKLDELLNAGDTDEEIAAQFDALINSFPDPDVLTLDEEEYVVLARGRYDALTPEQQALVTTLSVLEALEAQIEQLYLDEITEEGYINFLSNGHFTTLDGWDITWQSVATDNGYEIQSGALVVWASGTGVLDMSTTTTVSEGTYNLTLYINGGVFGSEFNVDEAYAYVKMGETTHQLDIKPTGWNNNTFDRVEIRNIDLSGEVELGFYINFTSGANNWVKIDDFTLWSLDEPLDPADAAAAQTVEDLITALPEVAVITTLDSVDIVAARDAYDLLTELQQSFVPNYANLQELEARLNILETTDPITLFNTEGTFEALGWDMSEVGWITDGGDEFIDGDTANTGDKSYNFFKDQTSLSAMISKQVMLDAGDYTLHFFLQGEGYTTITVTTGDTSNTFTAIDAYQEFTLSFTHTGGLIEIIVDVTRPDGIGWVTIDDVTIVSNT